MTHPMIESPRIYSGHRIAVTIRDELFYMAGCSRADVWRGGTGRSLSRARRRGVRAAIAWTIHEQTTLTLGEIAAHALGPRARGDGSAAYRLVAYLPHDEWGIGLIERAGFLRRDPREDRPRLDRGVR